MTENSPNSPITPEELAKVTREATDLDDVDLDLRIATSAASSKVYAAHGSVAAASFWADVTMALDDVRRERTATREAFEEVIDVLAFMRPPD